MTDDVSLADLLGFEERIAEPLRQRVRALAERWPLPGRLRSAAVDQVVERVRDRLSPRLYRVLAAAWRHHPACKEYCDTEKHPPGEVNTLELAEHKVEWACEPVVEVVADGLEAAGAGRLASLDFEVEVVAKIHAGVLTIQDARFIKMEAVSLTLVARMNVEAFSIVKFEVPVPLPGTIRFGEHGEPICPPAEPAEAPAAAPTQIAVPAIMEAPPSVADPSPV
ncbi:MAG TPA: hypothetical protein VEQ60_24540 [Longimicrobium sp.]|nr:hypothetical protein [Longimicrobium sp.]